MKLSQFFISRPIFAGVLSTLIFLAGLIALPRLSISEYPEVAPPTVIVKATYPGANPKVIADTVASPLEQSINGVEGMLYQSSQATADGMMTLTITYALGTDIDKAQVQVQNRVGQTLPKLPDVVQRLGVITNKASPDLTMVVHWVSPDNRYDTLYLSDYALLRVKDELARVGVATADLFPRVNITGFVGFLSGDVGRLLATTSDSNARAWSITPSVSWAAFDLGSARARLRASEAQSDAAAANYEKVVLAALEDTENSLVGASRRAAELAAIQYREGVADFLVLLDAQRTQREAEDSVAQSETAVNAAVVAIYNALGGIGQKRRDDATGKLARAP